MGCVVDSHQCSLTHSSITDSILSWELTASLNNTLKNYPPMYTAAIIRTIINDDNAYNINSNKMIMMFL